MGTLQRAFPNSTLRLASVVPAAYKGWQNIQDLLNCVKLRDVTLGLGRRWQSWPALAALGRQHGGRLQLQVTRSCAYKMLETEPSLAAYMVQAELPWSWRAGAGSGLARQVSSLSSLTKLTLRDQNLLLVGPSMLDALRQLSGLQSLQCLDNAMQMLLINSVPRSWSRLTELQLTLSASPVMDAPNATFWSLVEQQCPQLQALAMHQATALSLTALTSLTCQYWRLQDSDSFQCSQLAHLHVRLEADLTLLPSTLTSLALDSSPWLPPTMASFQDQHLRSQQSLVHICYTSGLIDLSDIRGLVPAIHPVLSAVTSVKLTILPQAFILPDMDGQHFRHLGACLPHLQRVHVHLQGRQESEEVLISAAWLVAHCKLVVTHMLACPVRVVKCPSGCLSLPLSSSPGH